MARYNKRNKRTRRQPGMGGEGGGSNVPCVCSPVWSDCGPIYDYTDPACSGVYDAYDWNNPDHSDPTFAYRCLCDSYLS